MSCAVKLGYQIVAADTVNIKTTPAGFFGLTATVAGAVTVHDGLDGTGDTIYAKTLAEGDVVHFGALGIATNIGLTVVAAGTVVVLYT